MTTSPHLQVVRSPEGDGPVITVGEEWPAMNAATERRLLGLIGLGMRARGVVVGVERVRDAAKRGRLLLAVVAPDVSRHSLDKIVPLLEARRVRIIRGPSAASLGAAVGKATTAVVGVTDHSFAAGVRALVEVHPQQEQDPDSHRVR
jgi:ribosomal protein L7Ae-like RNA K-turn-binding protein